jgi:hypothetical protein
LQLSNPIFEGGREDIMKYARISLILSLAASLLLAACGVGSTGAAGSNTLAAVKVDQVTLDSAAAFWANAPKLEVTTKPVEEDKPDGPVVALQAAYDANNLVIRAEWADSSESILKGAWLWDGSTFTRQGGNEDRLMFMWPIGNDAQFASKGCAAACHNQEPDKDDWWMGAASAETRYDVWQWQSARTHPANQADDEWLGHGQSLDDRPRQGDAKESGGAETNQNEAKDGPAFMHATDLASPFIVAGQETPLDSATLGTGATVPGYVVSPFVGSRGDVSTQAHWAEGKWVVVVMRPLNTGHDDDAVFTPPKPLPFGVSVVDDGAGLDHTTAAEVLTLEWK